MLRKILYSFLFMTVFLLIACQQTQQGQQDVTPIPIEIKYENNENKQQGDRDSRSEIDTRNFQLVGGPEQEVRKPNPVSNDILQKKFPDTLVLHGDPNVHQVALTFDDGPDVRFTPQVLDVLEKHDVRATFFLIGARASEHSDIVRRIHEAGHAIGNHTFWHPNLPNEGVERLHWELTETDKVIAEIVGFQPRLFRSPYGALNEEMMHMLQDMNYTVVGWDVDSLDWKQEGTEVIRDTILSNVAFGSIILMHDGGDWTMDLTGTVEALDEVITRLKQDGIEFVTVPEMVGVTESK